MPVLPRDEVPQLAAEGLMALRRTHGEDVLVSVVVHHLKQKAAHERVSDADYVSMRFVAEVMYNAVRGQRELRIGWRAPNGEHRRGLSHMLHDDSFDDSTIRGREICDVVDQLSIRGELHYFKLHTHFPNHLSGVRCLGSGRVRVCFKNGQTVDTEEDNLLNKDFLATCSMVYDL